ncbi:MAG: TenA family protein [Acidobacteriota bacterium]
MASFHHRLLRGAAPVWRAAIRHPFLLRTAAGTISRRAFARWMRQDYLYVRSLVPFLHMVAAGSPPGDRRAYAEAIVILHEEIDLFERMARARGIRLGAGRRADEAAMEPACRAYVSFVMAVGRDRPHPEAVAVLYGLERIYLDSWRGVRRRLGRRRSPWRPFIERWSGPGYRAWVGWLGRAVDRAARAASPATRARMVRLFLDTARHEVRFWDMALSGGPRRLRS